MSMVNILIHNKDTQRLSKIQATIYFTVGNNTQQLYHFRVKYFANYIRKLFIKLKYNTDISETGVNNNTYGVESWHSNFILKVAKLFY